MKEISLRDELTAALCGDDELEPLSEAKPRSLGERLGPWWVALMIISMVLIAGTVRWLVRFLA